MGTLGAVHADIVAPEPTRWRQKLPRRTRGLGTVLQLHVVGEIAQGRVERAVRRAERALLARRVLAPSAWDPGVGLVHGVGYGSLCIELVVRGWIALVAIGAHRVRCGVAHPRGVPALFTLLAALEVRVRRGGAVEQHELPRRDVGAREAHRVRKGRAVGRAVGASAAVAARRAHGLRAGALGDLVGARRALGARATRRVLQTACPVVELAPPTGLEVIQARRAAVSAREARGVRKVGQVGLVIARAVGVVAGRPGRANRVLTARTAGRLVVIGHTAHSAPPADARCVAVVELRTGRARRALGVVGGVLALPHQVGSRRTSIAHAAHDRTGGSARRGDVPAALARPA